MISRRRPAVAGECTFAAKATGGSFRKLSAAVIVAATSVWTPAIVVAAFGTGFSAHAQDTKSTLVKQVEDFWHYAKVARYDLAAGAADAVAASGAKPVDVLAAFESVSAARKDDLDAWLIRWSEVDALKPSTAKLIGLLNAGREARAADPAFIEDNIKRLVVNERAFTLAVNRLRLSGELAVPLALDYLRDPTKDQIYGPSVRRAIVALGRPALNPLVAASSTSDTPLQLQIIGMLGDLGYDAAAPFLAAISESAKSTAAVKDAANAALAKLNASNTKAAAGFLALGEALYYERSAITSQTAGGDKAFIWSWDEKLGLSKVDVPAPIYNEIMAKRVARAVMEIDPTQQQAVSLWLAANFKREAELPEGKIDPTLAANTPSAHYFGVASGARYLNDVLARAVVDRNSAVALSAIRALGEVGGASSLFAGTTKTPLVEALSFPDKVVRFEAAFALASARPVDAFVGQDAVVPILGEALSQTGKSGLLVLASSTEQINSLTESLGAAGYDVAGAITVDGLVAASSKLASVDVILAYEKVGTAEVDRMLAAAGGIARLDRTPKLIVGDKGSVFTSRAATDSLVSLTEAGAGNELVSALAAARKRGGSVALTSEQAAAYADIAVDLLEDLAMTRQSVLSPVQAEPALLAALDSTRPDFVDSVGEVLSLLPTSAAQPALLGKGADAKVPLETRVTLLKSLAANAKLFGAKLNDAQIAELQALVEGDGDQALRSAAAEALGALNLPAEKARELILGQGK